MDVTTVMLQSPTDSSTVLIRRLFTRVKADRLPSLSCTRRAANTAIWFLSIFPSMASATVLKCDGSGSNC